MASARVHITIRDEALRAKHIAEPALRRRVTELPAGAPLRLRIDGRPIRFRKTKNGRDRLPTPGLRVEPDDAEGRASWAKLQARRGDLVPVKVEEAPAVDPYLACLDELLWEWKTPEDAAAFDDL